MRRVAPKAFGAGARSGGKPRTVGLPKGIHLSRRRRRATCSGQNGTFGTPAERLFSRSAGSDWRLKVPFQLSPITKFQCLLSAFLFPDRIPYFVDEESLLA
jgi:hypothetical protein